MKKLLILSGKGGTGKTTIAGAFIKMNNIKAFADCDIDAPNLDLIIEQKSAPQKKDYIGMGKAIIDKGKCNNCGICMANCRFDSIKKLEFAYEVDTYSCEGCAVCEAICPQNAISINPDVAGELMLYNKDNTFSTAKLKMGSGTSGKLVTEVKKQLDIADKIVDIAIIDGSPGIGCPVIASITGVDMVLIVAEPSISGISDMKRIINTAKVFSVKIAICINKYDTNMGKTDEIEKLCKENGYSFLGKIPFDKNVVISMNKGKSIADTDCEVTDVINDIFKKSMNIIGDE